MVLYMDRKMKRWELALMCGVLCALALGGWLDREQERLADQVIRLHVIANSDSDADQALKLQVRDRILQETAGAFAQPQTRQAALATAQATACSRIGSKSASRLASLSFLEFDNGAQPDKNTI